jgi:hypothetical protein
MTLQRLVLDFRGEEGVARVLYRSLPKGRTSSVSPGPMSLGRSPREALSFLFASTNCSL